MTRVIGPDIAIVGSARSGSTFLAGLLCQHPLVDGPAVKEPDYFSFKFSEGPDWYDSMFPPRRRGHLRLDASVSYTYTEAAGALDRLAACSPEVRVVYLVRDPTERLVSHYLHYRDYAGVETHHHLGDALDRRWDYLGASDYAFWLDQLIAQFKLEQVLVVPFKLLTCEPQATLNWLLEWLTLSPLPVPSDAYMFANTAARPVNPIVGALVRTVLNSPGYPRLRSMLGATRVRRIRHALTRENSVDHGSELGTLSKSQLLAVEEVSRRAVTAVHDWLLSQDRRFGCNWSAYWDAV